MSETITIGKEITNFLCEQFNFTFGENFFYTRMPDTELVPVAWLIETSGNVSRELKTRQKIKEYQFLLYYRDKSSKAVDDKIFEIETILNRMTCIELDNFQLYSLKTSNLGTNGDIDSEGRFKGMLQLSVKIYDNYNN